MGCENIMINKELGVMYFCTTLTFCTLYATQPISPMFQKELMTSQTQVALFTTAVMTPLAFASILYGYILEKFSIKLMLMITLALLGISQIAFALGNSYHLMLNIRGFQGLILPAILTGIMSYISRASATNNVSAAIGYYVGITVVGGLLGRLLSGFFADIYGWRVIFFIFGFFLLISSFLVYKFTTNIAASFNRPTVKDIVSTLKIKANLYIFIMIFGIFFTFQAILNFIPFELISLDHQNSSSKISMVYAGYILGVVVSFNSKNIVKLCRTPIQAIIFAIIFLIMSMQLFRVGNFVAMFIAMLFICIGHFAIHSIAAGFVNEISKTHKAISNGMYISFFYAGGALGSFAPGFIYANGGWQAFLNLLTAVVFVSLLFMYLLNQHDKK